MTADAQKPKKVPQYCHGGRDGECNWKRCPQIRDNEPETTGRHCPLDNGDDDDDR